MRAAGVVATVIVVGVISQLLCVMGMLAVWSRVLNAMLIVRHVGSVVVAHGFAPIASG